MYRQLPYIRIQSPPLMLLIDTGATMSFLDPFIIKTHFNQFKCQESFVVSTSFASSQHDFVAIVPAFKEFNENINIKFYSYKFDGVFDGLIGIDVIDKLKAILDFRRMKFLTAHAIINMWYHREEIKLRLERLLPPRSACRIKIPVTSRSGRILVPQQEINNCIIPETVTDCQDGWCFVKMLNKSSKEYNFTLFHPIKTISLDAKFQLIDLEQLSSTSKAAPYTRVSDLIVGNEPPKQILEEYITCLLDVQAPSILETPSSSGNSQAKKSLNSFVVCTVPDTATLIMPFDDMDDFDDDSNDQEDISGNFMQNMFCCIEKAYGTLCTVAHHGYSVVNIWNTVVAYICRRN